MRRPVWMVVTGILVGLVALIVAGALIGGRRRQRRDRARGGMGRQRLRRRRPCGEARWSRSSTVVRSAGRSGTSRKRIGRRVAAGRVRVGAHRPRASAPRHRDDGGGHLPGGRFPIRRTGRRPRTGSSGWADGAVDEIEEAQDALGEDRTRRATRSSSSRRASRTIVEVYAAGGQAVAPTRRSGPGAVAALAESETCDQLQEIGEVVTAMDWFLVAVQGLIVIFFIFLGVRSGGIGLGLWGGVGTLILVFLFGLEPGEPPVSAMLIIIAVISAAAAMQAAGGIDYMVQIASTALRARPKALNFVAPYVSYVLTILTGTGNTFFSIIPVINEVAYANKIRPERALAGSSVASALGITSSPVAAATATLLAARRGVRLRPDRRPADHHPRQHHRHPPDGVRHEPPREGPRRRRRVPATPGVGRDQPSRTAGRHRPVRSSPSAASPSSSPASRRSASSASSRDFARPSPPRAAVSSRCRSRR